MASGKTHDKSIFLSLPGFWAIGSYYSLDMITLATFSGFYLFSGLYLSPDLDMKKSRPSQKWSILKFYWIPYRALFKHKGNFFNRNFYTHFPIIGSLIRFCYLLFIPGLLLVYNDFQNLETVLKYSMILYVAMELSALVHLIFDIIYTKRS
ncbi:hypothetical protein NIES2100_05210 [Calothrix sp. NIES-2100]|uniref:DUF2227 family putative metal-binding protein n=1 Tax=Calothrix sp. NIES-2100 TaxID=1954172 RepID=UPI000B5E46F3|nr:hypothetical protein NIES2100_05210 [Calothrix sp. NIES-2100]